MPTEAERIAALERTTAILEERTQSHATSDREDFAALRDENRALAKKINDESEKLWKKLDGNSRVLLGVLVALILNLVAGLIAIAVAIR